jgi:hypothetical protein
MPHHQDRQNGRNHASFDRFALALLVMIHNSGF